MSLITLRSLGLTLARPLFQDLSFTLSAGDRLGLVAGNGAGKSSLLRCLAGQQEATTGEITRARGLTLGLVEQDVPANLLPLPLAEALRRALPPAERESQGWQVELILDQLGAPAALGEAIHIINR